MELFGFKMFIVYKLMRGLNKVKSAVALIILSLMTLFSRVSAEEVKTPEDEMTTENGYRVIPFETIQGDTVDLADFEGEVVLLVNVASKCGFTPQYEGLEKLYKIYKDRGFTVIGFPANNFRNQEPGTNEEILKFCTTKFNVTFPMMAKISVKGEDIHPLYKYLTQDSELKGDIEWNFTKFLLDREGKPVARYATKTEPMSKEITTEIEAILNK
jgi:glutathione peroxidase-family protein